MNRLSPRIKNDSDRSAFRQTFLYQMPLSDIRIFRRFGETIFNYGLEMSAYPPLSGIPHARAALTAVLEDIEFLEEFLREAVDSPEEATSRERRLCRVAEATGLKLAGIAAELRVALGKKPRGAVATAESA